MSAIAISEELLTAAKNYLDITWDDTDTDAKLRGQLQRGMAYISAKTGVDSNSSAFAGDNADLRAQELLFNYLLYDRAGAANEFKKNYASDILGLKMRWEVANETGSGS